MKTIQHTNVVVYYDGVQVFAGQDDVGGQYVGAMTDTGSDGDRYLVASVTPDPLRRFYAGELDLRTLLLESSADGWYTALVNDDFEGPVSLEPQRGQLLDMDYLPEAGFYLNEAPSMNASDGSWYSAASPTDTDAMSTNSLDRLAFGLYRTNGTYAVLLGAGISSAAGIPTGWDIAVDLIAQIAKLHGEDPPNDPESWYQQRFGRPVNYSEIVQSLASTPAERSQLLSGYIEPDAEDIREGRKQPTLAHRVIARLAKHGRIRLILTTNIDRLMETALADQQIHPMIIHSPDDILGMVPLSHSHGECCVIKIHGDYKDIRSLNTASELEHYHEGIDRLLDQVFDEFGIIVCGWSARWDRALCNAVKRSASGRYSWFWAAHGTTSDAAEELIAHQRAQRIEINDADSFFKEVLRKVERLLGVEPQDAHPVEQGVAVLQGYLQQHLGLGGSDLADDLSSVVSQLFALSTPTEPEPIGQEDASELSKKIDIARELINRGLVLRAKTELERLWGSDDQISENLQARIAGNLAACAMVEEDADSAMRWADEAYGLQPDNPTAIANAALAAHQAGNTERALNLANRCRELSPFNSPATSVVMMEMWRSGEDAALDEYVAANAWVTQDEQCALVLSSIRLLQSRPDEAVELCRGRVAADDQDAQAHLALGQSLMKLSQEARAPLTYPNAVVTQLEDVVAEATQAIDLLQSTDLKRQRHAALILRGCARAILGFYAEAMADFDAALRESPNSSEANFYKALLHLNDGHHNEAIACFELVTDKSQLPDITIPFAHSLLSSGNPRAAAEMLRGSFDPALPGWDDIHRAEMLFRAEAAADEDSTVVPALEKALKQATNDPRLLALDAVVRNASEDSEGAEDALIRALECVDQEQRPEILMRLGFHHQGQGRFSKAADYFGEVVAGNAYHPMAVHLLGCLNNGRRLREALTWSRTLQESGQNLPRVVGDVELNILQLVGDATAAVSQCERICDHPEAIPVDFVNLASAQVRLKDFDAATRTVREIDRQALLEYPVSLLQLAQIKSLLGVDGYLEDAYAARRHGFDNAEVHIGYLSTILGHEQEIIAPGSIGPGCAVLLGGESGERWWSIVDHSEKPLGPHEIAPDHELAIALTDKQVGAKVVLRQGIEDLQYEVIEIQSKLVRAFQETAAEFSTRFPSNTKLSRVAVDDEDISKFLQVVDQQDKFVRNVAQLYREGTIPLGTLASQIHKSPLEVWRACTQHDFSRVAFAVGNDEESYRAKTLLVNADAITLDMVALFTVHELNVIDVLRKRFDRVAVPRLVLDSLSHLSFNTKAMGQTHGFIGKTEDGYYTMSEITEDERNRWKATVESVLAFAGSLETIPSYGLFDAPRDDQELFATLTTAGAGSIWAGEENFFGRELLISDDLGLSKIANAFGIHTANTQALILECWRSGALNGDDYSRIVERLAEMNYWFVQVRAEDIISSFVKSGYVTTNGTRAMLRTLQGPDCSEDSAIIVAVNVVVELASRTVPGQLDLIMGLMLSTLQRGRETSPVLMKFQEAIRDDSRLTPLARQEILASISAYHIGGITRTGHGLIVLRH